MKKYQNDRPEKSVTNENDVFGKKKNVKAKNAREN